MECSAAAGRPACDDAAEDAVDLPAVLDRVERLTVELEAAHTYSDKLRVVLGQPEIRAFLTANESLLPEFLSDRDAFLLLVLPALGQAHILEDALLAGSHAPLLAALERVEEAYDVLGGLAGYQSQCLRLLVREQSDSCGSSAGPGGRSGQGPPGPSSPSSTTPNLGIPKGLRLDSSDPRAALEAKRAVMAGIRATPRVAELWPVGGCADRLGLRCPATGEPLPAALLRYQGRPLLEGLVRDTTAREYLHWRAFGGDPEPGTPIALMTSAAKGNHARVLALCEARGFWGRGREGFRLVRQPDVPVLAAGSGRWLLDDAAGPLMKPGGHGVIWKLMLDAGVYDWFRARRRSAAVLRQISNPMAATDTTALALIGRGVARRKAFGFASCARRPGAAEGINVLKAVGGRGELGGADADGAAPSTPNPPLYAVTNVEYTEFARLGVRDVTCSSGSGYSAFPANANVLFADVAAVERALRAGLAAGDAGALLPGVTFNAGKRVTVCENGVTKSVAAGRLECTMQNLAERFAAPLAGDEEALPTFLVTGARRKVTSSAKRAWAPGSSAVQQTPQGSFYDLQCNAAELLGDYCGVRVPEIADVEGYLARGPDFIFLFHPALGPLWRIVGQKLRGGRLARRSELQLEIAEADILNLNLEGSLLIEAENVMGHTVTAHPPSSPGPEPRLVFSEACGRVRLHNLTVRNAGIDWADPGNSYWEHRVARRAACRVTLCGRSEFEARDATLSGDIRFVVPDGHRMLVTAEPLSARGWKARLEPLGPTPSWRWEYEICDESTDIWLRMHNLDAGVGNGAAALPAFGGAAKNLAPDAAAAGGRALPHPDLTWLSDQLADDSLFCSML